AGNMSNLNVSNLDLDLDRPNIEDYLPSDSIQEPLGKLRLRDLLDISQSDGGELVPIVDALIKSSLSFFVLHILLLQKFSVKRHANSIDEASDESTKEQMAIILRFVDNKGFIQERFFGVIHLEDTSSATLYSSIYATLSSYLLPIENICGQGYDGASNMRGEWNRLQSFFLKVNPCAYYIHCMAHRLQLTLVTTPKEVYYVHEFFKDLSYIVTVVGASCKRQDELQAAQAAQIEEMLQTGEIESGKGASQIGTVKQDKKDGLNFKTRGGASSALKKLTSFDFVFILHMMKTILGHANVLCKALQQKDQEVAQKEQYESADLSNQGSYDLDPILRSRSCKDKNDLRWDRDLDSLDFDIYNETIDFQLREHDSRFSEKIVELLELSSALDPRDGYVSFSSYSILKLAKKYYYLDFTEQELDDLEFQLKHFELDMKDHPVLGKLSSIADLCQGLAYTGKASHYYLADRLIRLVLTLLVSTASVERAFSAIKIVKNRLRNKMGDVFLSDNLVLYIEKDIAETFSLDSGLDDFSAKKRRVRLK
ncbi:zinc finger MYM-type protein 1-like protein, partial [Tanacetum coccineum]